MSNVDQRLKPTRVLLAGMKLEDNQINRALRRYPNVEVTWTNPDPGKFPLDADVAVIAIVQCSHQKYWDVKRCYKGKALFILREGFSEIRERFEKWLDERPKEYVVEEAAPKETALSAAFKEALAVQSAVPEVPTPAEPPKRALTNAEALKSKGKPLSRTTSFARECIDAGMSNKEIAEMCHLEGITTQQKTAVTESYVSMIRSTYKEQLKKIGREITPVKKHAANEPAPRPASFSGVTEAPRMKRVAASALQELIQKVIESDATPQAKLQKITDINAGKLSALERIDVTRLANDLLFERFNVLTGERKRVLMLNRDQCSVVLKELQSIRDFAAEPAPT